jgi:hypothetical protein
MTTIWVSALDSPVELPLMLNISGRTGKQEVENKAISPRQIKPKGHQK